MCFTTRTSRLAFLPVSTKQQWLVQSKRSTPTANQSAMALSGSTAVCCDSNYNDYTQNYILVNGRFTCHKPESYWKTLDLSLLMCSMKLAGIINMKG